MNSPVLITYNKIASVCISAGPQFDYMWFCCLPHNTFQTHFIDIKAFIKSNLLKDNIVF